MSSSIISIIKLLISPLFLFSLALIITVLYAVRKGTNFLNFSKVFRDYFTVFKDAKSHIAFFWGVPALLTAAIIQIVQINSNLAETLIVFLSILISAFFAMLSILISKQTDRPPNSLYILVLNETASTVLFEIVLCIASLLVSLCIVFLEAVCSQLTLIVLSVLVFYLVFVMIFNILILIKRFKALIDNA